MFKKKTNVKISGKHHKISFYVVFCLIIFAVIMIFALASNDDGHIYDKAEVHDLMNGSGTEKIGEYSVIKLSSSEITEDVLNDWYFNYVKKHDFNYSVIIYTDKDTSGIYASNGFVSQGATLSKDSSGDYVYSSSDNEIIYYPSPDGTTLQKFNNSSN